MRTNLFRPILTLLLIACLAPLGGCATLSAKLVDLENTKANRNLVWQKLNEFQKENARLTGTVKMVVVNFVPGTRTLASIETEVEVTFTPSAALAAQTASSRAAAEQKFSTKSTTPAATGARQMSGQAGPKVAPAQETVTPEAEIAFMLWGLTRTEASMPWLRKTIEEKIARAVQSQGIDWQDVPPELRKKVLDQNVEMNIAHMRRTAFESFRSMGSYHMKAEDSGAVISNVMEGAPKQVLNLMLVVSQNTLRSGGLVFGCLLDTTRTDLLEAGKPIPLE